MTTRLIALLLLFSSIASAQQGDEESNWRLGAALGYGERSNPIVYADDIPLVVDLDIAWFGERFFFDNGDLGLTFADNESLTANLVARVRSDRVFFGLTNNPLVSFGLDGGAALETPVRVEVPDRDFAIEAGVELLADGRWGYLQLAAFHDVSGTHKGYDVDAAYGVGFKQGRWYVEPEIGLTYQSRRLNDYYWGIQPSESNAATPVYDAGAGVNARARLRVSYYFSRSWAATLSAEYEWLNDAIVDSPIVVEDGVLGWFAGMAWRFR